MLVCNYCGRNLKKEYNICPGCGSSKFERINDFGKVIIKNPPEGGYKINTDNYEKTKKNANIVRWCGWIFIIFAILLDLPFILAGILSGRGDVMFGITFSSISIVNILPLILIGVVVILFAKYSKNKAEDNVKRLQKLAMEGVLVKNMPYKLVKSGAVINGNPIYCMQVEYENASGQIIPLKSEAKYNNVLSDKDGTVDLLIDPNDYSNFFIDIEIY